MYDLSETARGLGFDRVRSPAGLLSLWPRASHIYMAAVIVN